MEADEEGTLERLQALRRELVDPKIAERKGRVVKTTGDGLLVKFAGVVGAVRCAVAVQQVMPKRNRGVGADNRWVIGTAHFLRHNAACRSAGNSDFSDAPAHPRVLLCATGGLDEAREIVKRLHAITPVVAPRVIPYRNPEHRELFLSGLRVAAGGDVILADIAAGSSHSARPRHVVGLCSEATGPFHDRSETRR